MAESSAGSPQFSASGGSEAVGSPPGKPSKICGVCGDRAKSYHFGGLSCDSCKAFFRRSVQNDAHRNFQCPYEGRCEISVTSRKCCQFCRFQKCVSIGMEKSWVMTEEERIQLLRQRMIKKKHLVADVGCQGAGPGPIAAPPVSGLISPGLCGNSGAGIDVTTPCSLDSYDYTAFSFSTLSEHEPDVDDLNKYMTENEIQLIKDIIHLYQASYRKVPYPPELTSPTKERRSNVDIVTMFSITIKRFSHFIQQLESFRRLSNHDRTILLRTGMVEMCVIRGVHSYDADNDRWPDTSKELYKDSPWVRVEDISRLVSPETFAMHMRFTRGLRELQPDEPTLMLLLLIVLFSPERHGLRNPEAVQLEQDTYSILLRSYMNWRYSPEAAGPLYAKLLLKLPDLRELNDAHTIHAFRLGSEELAEIQTQLDALQLVETQASHSPSHSPKSNLQYQKAQYKRKANQKNQPEKFDKHQFVSSYHHHHHHDPNRPRQSWFETEATANVHRSCDPRPGDAPSNGAASVSTRHCKSPPIPSLPYVTEPAPWDKPEYDYLHLLPPNSFKTDPRMLEQRTPGLGHPNDVQLQMTHRETETIIPATPYNFHHRIHEQFQPGDSWRPPEP